MMHATLQQAAGSAQDHAIPSAVLFGTTAVDIVSAVSDRLDYLLTAAVHGPRISIVLHMDSAVAMIRHGNPNICHNI